MNFRHVKYIPLLAIVFFASKVYGQNLNNTVSIINWKLELLKNLHYYIVAIGGIITLILGIIKYFNERTSALRNKIDEQFIKLTIGLENKDSFFISNIISVYPIFLEYRKKIKKRKEYNEKDIYIDENYYNFPYIRETLNIIINSLILEQVKRTIKTSNEPSIIEIASSETISKITQSTLETIKINGKKRNSSFVDFRFKNLSGLNFNRVDLTGALLSYAKMENSTFLASIFEDAELNDCNFNDAILDFSVFRKANLADSNFESASLVESKFEEAYLNNTTFLLANLEKAEMSNCEIYGNSSFECANLAEVKLISAIIEETDFINANLQNSIFKKATINQSFFTGANIIEVDFSEVNSSDNDFTDCVIDKETYGSFKQELFTNYKFLDIDKCENKSDILNRYENIKELDNIGILLNKQ